MTGTETLGARIRAAYTRWATRATGPVCGCSACIPQDVYDSDTQRNTDVEADAHREVTRATHDYLR